MKSLNIRGNMYVLKIMFLVTRIKEIYVKRRERTKALEAGSFRVYVIESNI